MWPATMLEFTNNAIRLVILQCWPGQAWEAVNSRAKRTGRPSIQPRWPTGQPHLHAAPFAPNGAARAPSKLVLEPDRESIEADLGSIGCSLYQSALACWLAGWPVGRPAFCRQRQRQPRYPILIHRWRADSHS